MDWLTFSQLSTPEIATMVRAAGPKVVVFPINGTRRWFMLEYPGEPNWDLYLTITWGKHLELYRLLFEHGLDTLVTPIYGPELLRRGSNYLRLVERGLAWLGNDQAMLDFYEQFDVRVRIYGDTAGYFCGTPYEPVLETYEAVTKQTAHHSSRRLFFGVCAHDASENVAAFGARYFQAHGKVPGRKEIITAYYGEYVEPVSFFIGFDRPTVFDMPLIATGEEDLYFTVNPSCYLDETGLRMILYDHLYGRRVNENYGQLSPADWQWLKTFYTLNRHQILGVGQRALGQTIWLPTTQLTFPDA